MTAALPYRPWLTAPLVAGGAAVFGALVAVRPEMAAGLVGLGLIVLLAFAAPTAHLLLLVFLTALVPYGVQNQVGLGGGAGAAGLLLSDAVLLTGLARAAWVLLRRLPTGIRLAISVLVVLFLFGVALQLVRGVLLLGLPANEVGAEARVLLGFGAALVAFPLLDDQRTRTRLMKGLAVLALLIGLWGIVQWTVDIPFAAAGDVGVRSGVGFTTSGRGQVQGGLYAFAPVTVMLFAVLAGGVVRALGMRILLVAAFIANAVSLILTYERTFWVVALLGLALVIVRTGGTQRIRAAVATPVALVGFLAILATVAPDTLGAARERLMSIGQYATDNSLRYRVVESRHVVEEIAERPILGSAPGATIVWGRPWEQVLPESTVYAHNGYLWLVWKLGLPLALSLLAVLLATIIRPPPRAKTVEAALARGSQIALLMLLLASVTFPSFSALSITVVMGVLMAMAVAAPRESGPPDRRSRLA